MATPSRKEYWWEKLLKEKTIKLKILPSDIDIPKKPVKHTFKFVSWEEFMNGETNGESQ